MKQINLDRKANRKARHLKTLRKIRKIDNGLPKLIVTKSNSHTYAQLVDTIDGKVLASSSSLQLKLANGNIENSIKVAQDISKKILDKKIGKITFDRNGSKYHGKVSAIAETLREAGIKF